ncbi:hypothetical protein BP5796_09329 [Coleophoma crateriformis]|uniref:F-box domain-containing protein n=1 Tax=Coleophoma crateriformis TaxID=565419 RepID=A0A3D8R3P2_9HELO|nr:hypothetical protein BP5796_09329 [Coleophoma crateriformis]
MASTDLVTRSETFFDKIPRDTLLLIVAALPDLPTLFNLSQSCSAVTRLIDECGAYIIEDVMRDSLRPEIQDIIRVIVQLRSSSPSVEDFNELSTIEQAGCAPIPATASSKALHGILLSVDRIHHLSQCCLQHMIDRCMNMRPSHLADPNFAWSREHRTRPWEGGGFSKADIEGTEEKGIMEFCDPLIHETEEIMTAWEFIHDSANAGLFQALPFASATPQRLALRSTNRKFHDTVSTSEPVFENPMEDGWYEGAYSLGCGAPGVSFGFGRLKNDMVSPLRYTTFKPFRKFGFAIWDRKRMFTLELLNPPYSVMLRNYDGELYFTWKSILSPDELAEIENRQLEARNKSRQEYIARMEAWKARKEERRARGEERRALQLNIAGIQRLY